MRPSFVEGQTPFFFSQRRDRQFQRRFRKTLDDVSVFGEKRDPLGRADGESVVSSAWLRAKRRGSATSGRRVSLSGKIVLPLVDKDGPRFVSGEQETKSVSGEGTQNALASLPEEKEVRSGWTKVKEVYKFDELKFGSTSILSNLGKCLDSAPVREHITDVSDRLDPELLHKFLQSHQSLISDTVVEKREWQTDCYLDLSIKNKHPFLIAPPTSKEEEEGEGKSEERRKSDAVVSAISKRYTQQQLNPTTIINSKPKEKKPKRSPPKRVTLNQEAMSRVDSPKRPQTARSILSNISFHSDYSRPSSSGESRINDTHYDALPAELRPSIMLYKRESTAPKVKVKGPRTRLEKYRDQISCDRRKPGRLKRSQTVDREPQESIPKATTIGRRPLTAVGAQSPAATQSRVLDGPQHTAAIINFSLTDSDTHDKGWLVHAAETQDPEMATLRIWDKKSKERLRKREEEKMIAKQKYADGPLVVKFYSNPQTRSLRSKHQRSATFPLPTVLNKLPPSVANFTTPGVASGDVMMIGEGPELAVLIHPDGSGHANYHSKYGQCQAVCQSRTEPDSKGLYTVAYDDTEFHPLLACFSPLGRGWCYFPGSGTLRMFYDTTELRMYSEDGHVTRKILWISDKTSVSIQLNPCLSFHCTSLTNMVLRFSCRGQTYKFHLSPPTQLSLDPDKSTVALQSGLEFISDAARAYTKDTSPPPALKPALKTKKTLKRNQSMSDGVGHGVCGGEEEEEMARQTATNLTALEKNLSLYRDRVKSTVDDWMSHYRQTIGISLPAHLRTTFSRSSSPIQRSGSTRQLYSSRSYCGDVVHSRPTSQVTRFHTHPLPSRVTSPFGGQRSPCTSPPAGEDQRTEYMTTPPPTTPPRTTPSPSMTSTARQLVLEERGWGQRSEERRTRRRRSNSVPSKRYGCPVALHNLLSGRHDTMSPCKCDKRRPPYIKDLEYDLFLRSHIPSTQVVVVCVLSSVVEGSCLCEPMLDALHHSINRRRFSPCTQSSGDTFRVMKYDLGHALTGTARKTPLLVERHKAWPGMFLMYVGGRLVHADCVFNGYGTTKRDFLKQVERCLQEASKGHYLPTDYHFTAQTGGKHPGPASWAYPLTGVLGFLIPYTPSVSSHHSSSLCEEDRELPRQNGRSGVGLDLSHSDALSLRS